MALGDVGGFHDGLFLIFSTILSPIAATLFENDLLRGSLFNWKVNKYQQQSQARLVRALSSSQLNQ